VEDGATVMLPPLYGSVYEVPFEPLTWIDAALVSVTVSVSDCPAEIDVDCAVMETVGTDAAALTGRNAATENKARTEHTKNKRFTGAALCLSIWVSVERR
jgi:hypothetical protein